MSSLGFLSPSSILRKLRSFHSFRQNLNPNQEHNLNNNNIIVSQESSVAQQEDPLVYAVPSPVNQEFDQTHHQHQISSKVLTIAVFLSTNAIYLLVNTPADSLLNQYLLILYSSSLHITFFVGLGLLFYTIFSDESSQEVILVQFRLMILGLWSMIGPLLIRTSFRVESSILGLSLVWMPPLIAVGLSFWFLFAANHLLQQLPSATTQMTVAP